MGSARAGRVPVDRDHDRGRSRHTALRADDAHRGGLGRAGPPCGTRARCPRRPLGPRRSRALGALRSRRRRLGRQTVLPRAATRVHGACRRCEFGRVAAVRPGDDTRCLADGAASARRPRAGSALCGHTDPPDVRRCEYTVRARSRRDCGDPSRPPSQRRRGARRLSRSRRTRGGRSWCRRRRRPIRPLSSDGLRPAPERSPASGFRTDFTGQGFWIRPPSVAFDLFYAVDAVATDRADATRLLEHVYAELTPTSVLDVAGRPLTIEWVDGPSLARTEIPGQPTVYVKVSASQRSTVARESAVPPFNRIDVEADTRAVA